MLTPTLLPRPPGGLPVTVTLRIKSRRSVNFIWRTIEAWMSWLLENKQACENGPLGAVDGEVPEKSRKRQNAVSTSAAKTPLGLQQISRRTIAPHARTP